MLIFNFSFASLIFTKKAGEAAWCKSFKALVAEKVVVLLTGEVELVSIVAGGLVIKSGTLEWFSG